MSKMLHVTPIRLARGMVLLAVAAGLLPSAGCEDEPCQMQCAMSALCCSEFVAGQELSTVDWGEPPAFGAYMQAAGDVAVASSDITRKIAAACEAIARDLGAQSTGSSERDAVQRAKTWCAIAAAQLAETTAQGAQLSIQPAIRVEPSARLFACEARCLGDALQSCGTGTTDLAHRCPDSASTVACRGVCAGTCDGSATLPVDCDGDCQGECDGACDGSCHGSCDGQSVAGTCPGQCRGVCAGTCAGACRGSCQLRDGAGVQCVGGCRGKCDHPSEPRRCSALEPVSCSAAEDESCLGWCRVDAAARAEWREPVVCVGPTAGSALTVLQSNVLATHLPVLLAALDRGRGIRAALPESLEQSPPTTGVKGLACRPRASAALAAAVDNLASSLDAGELVYAVARTSTGW